ncbi:MAG: lysine--tRNA ligase [Nanoarchaeota archaeon]
MGRQDEVLKERLKKIEEIKKLGINPYPHFFEKTDTAAMLQKEHEKLKPEQKSKANAKIAGRLVSLRDLGKIAFGVLQDESGKIQIVLQEPDTSEKVSTFFKKYIDLGDFAGVEGTLFRTKRGELSVLVKKAELLSKSLQSLPDKWHGLEDKEERYRKRYLDLIMSPEVKETFHQRSAIISTLRSFLESKGFIETDTPILQPLYGGGAARPFISELHALKMPVYLAISKELYLKRLIVGGFERVYEMNRIFRNEGIDATHNPEFTMLETMWAYVDYRANMDLFEEMVEFVAKKVRGTTKITYQEKEIELKRPWKRLTLYEAIKKYVKIDVASMSDNDLREFIAEHKLQLKTEFRRGVAIEEIFSELVQPKLIEPTIIYDYPAEVSPLAKRKATDPTLAERFEPIINGWEMGNNYSELNEPITLRKVFEAEAELKKKGDEEAAPYDEDFINALEIGMPPTSGLGLGVDRLVMLLTNSASIRDVLLFPFMKLQNLKEDKNEEQASKSQVSQSAIAVLNTGSNLSPWQQMNTVAHLTAALGARKGKSLLLQDQITTKDNQKIALNIQHAIMIKQASSNKELTVLTKAAKEVGCEVTEFTKEMIETTDDRKVIEQTANKSLKDVEFLGVLIFGKRSIVDSLTQSFSLFTEFASSSPKKEKKGGKL